MRKCAQNNMVKQCGWKLFLLFVLWTIAFSGYQTALSEQKSNRVTFCAVGDILMDRGIKNMMRKYGWDYPFRAAADFIRQFDIAFCNLEGPISNNGAPVDKRYVFCGDPASLNGLKKSGFDIISLANNHILDYGYQALMDTIRILEEKGFYPIGAGKDQATAGQARIIHKNGLSFAFLAYVTYYPAGIKYSRNKPGGAYAYTERIIEEIKKVREKVDYVIVSSHWGNEYEFYPTDKQRKYAHLCIDNGADLVLGHHPHVIQSIEKYKGKYIIYSLGNFIFDQHRKERRQSIIFACTFQDGEVKEARIVPVIIENFQPRIAHQQEAYYIIEKIKLLSKDYNVAFIKKEDIAYIK